MAPKTELTNEDKAGILRDSLEVEAKTGLTPEDQMALVQQVLTERRMSYDFMNPKWEEWAVRLKLYNNQRRNKKAIGDTLMYTTFQTLFSALYQDELMSEFVPREEGDTEHARDLNEVMKFDFVEMQKSKLDYQWIWDSMFFGRGICDMMGFDRKRMCPAPEIIDPMTWYRDPSAKSINGDMQGRGAMRFGGRDIMLPKNVMEAESNVYFNVGELQPETGVSNENRAARAEEERLDAQGFQSMFQFSNLTGGQEHIHGLEWRTIFKGKRVIVTLANNYTKIVRYNKLKQQEKWGMIDRPFSPMSHDWDGVSVSDITEDKQRARAVLKNLALQGVEYALYPMFMYNANRIKNRNYLNLKLGKHIPVEGDPSGSIQAVPKPELGQQTDWMLKQLDQDAQDATATPALQQGTVSSGRQTAFEVGLMNQKADTRFSLTAKVFGWSEEAFWRQWYKLYKLFFDSAKAGLDKKTVRITGMTGAEFRTFTRENLITEADPDVYVQSKAVARAEKMQKLGQLTNLKQNVAGNPDVNMNALDRKIAQESGLTLDEIDRMFPKSFDELMAEDENKLLNEKKPKKPKVSIRDNHELHIEIHQRAKETKEKQEHLKQHKAALMLIKRNPEALPQGVQQDIQQQQAQQQQMKQMQVQKNVQPIAPPTTPQ